MAPPGSRPYQLLEVNLISAQDLEPVAKKMTTHCKAWVHPSRKLTSCEDTEGHNNPTWNDKFVFRVNDDFLREETSAVMIEIYNPHWFKDTLVGTVRVLIGNLFPPTVTNPAGMRFVALQVRRPSGRPQGILNIGVALLDGSLRSMPMYKDCASAVGYRDLMLDLPPNFVRDDGEDGKPRPIFLRSRSERSIGFDVSSSIGSAVVPARNSSILSISEPVDPLLLYKQKGKGKASSVINGAELIDKPNKIDKGKGKASSVVSDSVYSKSSSFSRKDKPKMNINGEGTSKMSEEKPAPETATTEEVPVKEKQIAIEIPSGKFISGGPYRGSSILSASEIGPSASEVAAAMMVQRRYPLDDNQSSMLDGWSMDESEEGLKSKLQRWRSELPPVYDHQGYSTATATSSSTTRTRRRRDSSSGLFTCFGSFCGYEYQLVCGQPNSPKGKKRRGGKPTSSVDSSESSIL